MNLFYLCKTCGKTYPKGTPETTCCRRPLVLSLEGGYDLSVSEVVHYLLETIVEGVKTPCYFCNLAPIIAGKAVTDWDLVNCKRCLLKKQRLSKGASR